MKRFLRHTKYLLQAVGEKVVTFSSAAVILSSGIYLSDTSAPNNGARQSTEAKPKRNRFRKFFRNWEPLFFGIALGLIYGLVKKLTSR